MRARALFRRVGTAPPLLLILLYRRLISPFMVPRCRYHPSCSAYAVQALRKRGLVAGIALAIARVMRCNPWSLGGIDHVPSHGWRNEERAHTDSSEPIGS